MIILTRCTLERDAPRLREIYKGIHKEFAKRWGTTKTEHWTEEHDKLKEGEGEAIGDQIQIKSLPARSPANVPNRKLSPTQRRIQAVNNMWITVEGEEVALEEPGTQDRTLAGK